MKYVLGIKYGGHDSSAALLVNGKLVAACAQERYTRDKHSKLFPTEAINDCLKAAIEYNKNFYSDTDIDPEEQLLFTLTIVPFSKISSTNINK